MFLKDNFYETFTSVNFRYAQVTSLFRQCSQVDNALTTWEECLLQSDKFRHSAYTLPGPRYLKMLL